MEAETPNAQDARVEKLWAALDARKKGELDLAGLKKGLGKLDHRTPYLASTMAPC